MTDYDVLAGKIQVLEDIEAIKRMKARYWYCVDNRDWEGLAECYAEDADFECPMTGRLQGRKFIVRFLQRVMKDVKTVHQGHSPEIEIIDAASARGRWGLNDYVRTAEKGSFRGYGYYEDEYVKTGGAWQIRKSRLTYIIRENGLGAEPGGEGNEQ